MLHKLRIYFSIQKRASPPFIRNDATKQPSVYFILFELNQTVSTYSKSWTQTPYYISLIYKSINQKQCFDFFVFLRSRTYNVAEKNFCSLLSVEFCFWFFFFLEVSNKQKLKISLHKFENLIFFTYVRIDFCNNSNNKIILLNAELKVYQMNKRI